VRAAVEEKNLPYIRAGRAGKAVLACDGTRKLPVRVEKVLPVPVAAGDFEAWLAVDLGKDTDGLMPGMACTVKFVPYSRADALTVPVSAVFTEELDDDQHYVYLAGKDGTSEKRPVTTGKKCGDKVEILAGVQDGDQILLEKPDGTKQTASLPKKEAE